MRTGPPLSPSTLRSGKFNDIEESKLTMTWQLKDEKSFPKISAMYLTDVSVVKNGGWVDYE